MRVALGVGICILLLTSCGYDDSVQLETTESSTTTTTVHVRIEAPPTPKEVDEGALYLRLVHADRTSRSRKRTTDNSSARAPRPNNAKPVAKGSVYTSAGDNGSVGRSDEGVWAKLGACESGNNPNSVSADRKYWGAFQFSLGTWHSIGEAGNPIDYGYAYQLAAAQRLQARSGWGQWPRCARRLGLL